LSPLEYCRGTTPIDLLQGGDHLPFRRQRGGHEGEMRCLLEKSRYGRLKARGSVSVFGPDYAISRVRHHLEGMAFVFSENRTKVTLFDPAQVEKAIEAIVTRRL